MKWISVKDKLPKEDYHYCVLAVIFGMVYPMKFSQGIFKYFSGVVEPSVTHWMPLPEPPKTE